MKCTCFNTVDSGRFEDSKVNGIFAVSMDVWCLSDLDGESRDIRFVYCLTMVKGFVETCGTLISVDKESFIQISADGMFISPSKDADRGSGIETKHTIDINICNTYANYCPLINRLLI